MVDSAEPGLASGRVLTACVDASEIEHVSIYDAFTGVNTHGLANDSAAVTTQRVSLLTNYTTGTQRYCRPFNC